MRTEHTVGYISIQSGCATRECKYFEAPAVARVPLVKAGSSLEFRRRSRISLSLSASREISLRGPPIIHTKVYEALWKHPLPDVWIALIEDGSSTGRTCNRFNCINRWESDGWVDECPDISFFSLCKAARRVFMQSRAFSIFELIDIKRDSIYIGLNFPEKYR